MRQQGSCLSGWGKCLRYPGHIYSFVHMHTVYVHVNTPNYLHREISISLVTNGRQEPSLYPFQDYPFLFPLPPPKEGLSCAVYLWTSPCIPVPALHCSMDQSNSGEDMVGRRQGRKERNFNRGTLSFHMIVDQWHFPVLKRFSFCLTSEMPLWILSCFLTLAFKWMYHGRDSALNECKPFIHHDAVKYLLVHRHISQVKPIHSESGAY